MLLSYQTLILNYVLPLGTWHIPRNRKQIITQIVASVADMADHVARQVRAAVARRIHWLTALAYLPVGIHFWRQGAPGWAIAADAAAYLGVTLLVLPTCMALAEVRSPVPQLFGSVQHIGRWSRSQYDGAGARVWMRRGGNEQRIGDGSGSWPGLKSQHLHRSFKRTMVTLPRCP